jgi:S-adenosylmethionine synthetase
MYHTITSESVSQSHPDKICDQIADAIVDACLRDDPSSRVAVDCIVTRDRVVLFGEITTRAKIDYKKIARQVINQLGYASLEERLEKFQNLKSDFKPVDYIFSDQTPIDIFIHTQAADISQGVDIGGAGDQGMMYGYACRETPELMPLPIMLAHSLVKNLDQACQQQTLPYLRPDGKSQLLVTYYHAKPVDVPTLIMAVPQHPKISNKQLKADLTKLVIQPALEKYLPKRQFKISQIIINGTGKWEIGGPAADSGLTGKKTQVDSYGGVAHHGGGAFSGKDPTKVDRSGAYAARYLAKNIVAANLADRCEVQLAYVIGQTKPVAFEIETFDSNKKSARIIKEFAKQILNPTLPNILKKMNLRRPIYQPTARYGHFGNKNYEWEKLIEL